MILIIDDEKRFLGHPDEDDFIFANNAQEAIVLLKDRNMVDLKEVWLDWVLCPGDIIPVLEYLAEEATRDYEFTQYVTLRTVTSSSECAETIKKVLSAYKFGQSPVL